MEDKTINIRLDELKKKMKLIQVCEDDLDINLKAKVNGLGDSSNYGELENRIQIVENEKLAISQGSNNANKNLITDSQGNIVVEDKPKIPVNSDFTLSGLSEKSYNSLTDKPNIPTDYVTLSDLSLNLSYYSTKEFVEGGFDDLGSRINEKADISLVNNVSNRLNETTTKVGDLEYSSATKEALASGINEAKNYTTEKINQLRGISGDITEGLNLYSVSQQVNTNTQNISSVNTEISTLRTKTTQLDNRTNTLSDKVNALPTAEEFALVVTSTTGNAQDISRLSGKIDSTNEKVTELQSELQEIQGDIADLPDFNKFITNSVDNLANYYLKSETYTQQQVNNLIGDIKTIHFEVVSSLPATGETNYIYLVSKTGKTNDVYNEYIYANNNWERIGDTTVDLSNYYNKTEADNKLAEKLNLSGGTMTGAIKLATGTSKGILNGTKNVIQTSSNEITIGNSTDNLKLNGKLIYVNGKSIATLQDINDAVQNGKLTIKQNGTELGSFTANNIDNVEVNISTENLAKLDATNLTTLNVTSWKNKLGVVEGNEKTTLLYDRTSSNSSINLSYTSGIQPNVSISLDLTNYKKIKIYYVTYNNNSNDMGNTGNVAEMDLTNSIDNVCNIGITMPYRQNGSYGSTFSFLPSYNKLTKKFTAYWLFNNGVVSSSLTKYFVHKIEGVE